MNTLPSEHGLSEQIRAAINAKTLSTVALNSGVQVSGIFSEILCDPQGNPAYLRTNGPTQLAWKGTELPDQGTAHHRHGFGSPVGGLRNLSRCLSEYSIGELSAQGIETGRSVRLEFRSGVTVEGDLQDVYRHEGANLLFSFSGCTVNSFSGECLFDPTWGVYDMAVGASIESVCAGPADSHRYRVL